MEINGKKALVLDCVEKQFKDKTTGESRKYFAFQVDCNGIPITLKATDYTAQNVLLAYFGKHN